MALSTDERIFLVLQMAKCDESIIEVQRAWKREINRNPPTLATIRNTYKRFKDTGNVHDHSFNYTKQCGLEHFEENPRT